ncbi:Predicted PurR-regulated permease PerM [Catalinimonas alkaloidigena]|uniref:Predicted PurR-regulated permease PerM n=1 Tax=Catalinimonas alkaloidigena TaxID=1075417 RepID=A0A1G9DYC1_9BACT|nr:AI-2E family transporter [Catalinimonas alkaloidigena]SDK68891.1 Predicted PurR-regulated permease PerM [Catalinimonas alkaloidigena]
MQKLYPTLVRLTVALLFLILLVFALTQARNVLYPLALAILFAYLLRPVAEFLERLRVPRIAANLLSILLMAAVVGSVFFFLYNQFSVFTDDFPLLKEQAKANIHRLEMGIEATLGISTHQQHAWLTEQSDAFFNPESGQRMLKFFSATTSTLVAIFLIPVYIFFLLYYRDKFREFVLQIAPARHHPTTLQTLEEISTVTARYMGGLVMVVAILCVLNSTGLMLIGIRYPILFGIVSAMINFIPYFGTLAGGSIPFLFALLLEDSPRYALWVALFFLLVQFLENNILTPNIVGGQVSINPLFIILSLLVGAALWGIPGMFVIVPYLAMFKIVCDHVERLRPVSYLISTHGTEKHALTWAKIKSVFVRNTARS